MKVDVQTQHHSPPSSDPNWPSFPSSLPPPLPSFSPFLDARCAVPPSYHYHHHRSHAHSFHAPSYDRPAHERPTYNRPSYSRPSHDRPSFDRPTFDHPSFDRPPFDRPSFDRPPFDRPSFDRPSFDRPSYSRPSHERPIYDRPSHDRPPQDRWNPRLRVSTGNQLYMLDQEEVLYSTPQRYTYSHGPVWHRWETRRKIRMLLNPYQVFFTRYHSKRRIFPFFDWSHTRWSHCQSSPGTNSAQTTFIT